MPAALAPSPALIKTLCGAIQRRNHVLFLYDSHARAVEPHILGFDHAGQALLSAWQLLGGSGEGFRTFHLDELRQLTVSDTRFEGPRPEYNPGHNIFAEVVCQL